jgi:protease secretion system outer membrane protein
MAHVRYALCRAFCTLAASFALAGTATAQFVADLPALSSANRAEDVVDLSRAWRSVLQYDHTYLAAISERAASETERAQGRAGLLPKIDALLSKSKVTGFQRQPDFFGTNTRTELQYDSVNEYVQLQQPIFNYQRFAEYRRGNARADQGAAAFAVKAQQTGTRVAELYFNTLLAYDNLGLQRSRVASIENQLKSLQAQYQRNEGTMISVQETRARLDVARADILQASDQLVVNIRDLEGTLGSRPTRLAALRSDFPLAPLVPASLQEWRDRARVNNADVRTAREALNVADAEVDRAKGAYYPSLDLIALYSKGDSQNLSTLSQKSNTFSIGLNLSVPIFTGGYNTAVVSQSGFNRENAQHTLDAAMEKTDAEVVRQYTNVTGGGEQVRALETAVDSNQLALESVRKGFSLGTWSNVDVLNAQDKLYQAKYDLIRGKLQYLLARLALAAAAGDLGSAQFDEINDAYLGPAITLVNGIYASSPVADGNALAAWPQI